MSTKKNTTLLQKALAHSPAVPPARKLRSKFEQDELTVLAVAWMHGDIGTAQLCAALGRETSSSNSAIATAMGALRESVRTNRTKIIHVE